MDKAQELRELFNKRGVIRIVGAHDGITAKLVELNGFEVSTSYALPDANILTMTQCLRAASTMNKAVTIPIVAGCDTGYGNSSKVMHMKLLRAMRILEQC